MDAAALGADIRILQSDWNHLCEQLLGGEDEHAALLICGLHRDQGNVTYLVREVIVLTDEDYVARGHDHLSVSPTTLARYAKRARLAESALVLVHSHPFPGSVGASRIDLRTELDLCRRVLSARTGAPAAALVIGPGGCDGRSWTVEGATPLRMIHVIGERISRLTCSSRGSPIAAASVSRGGGDLGGATDRQELLWGSRGQTLLRQSHVTVVGCGGTGSHIAIQLAHLRVGQLTLIDDDRIEASNLSRIIGATPRDIGRLKAEVLADLCCGINPDIQIAPVAMSVLDADPSRYTGADVIVCATDSHGSRSLLTEVATQYLIPLVDLGVEVVPGGGRFHAGGGVRILRPGQGCLWCAQTLSPALVREEYLDPSQRAVEVRRGYIRGNTEPAPSVVALNGVVASLAVLEVCQLLVGMLGEARTRLLYRAERRAVTTTSVPRNPACHVCGESGVLARGDALAVKTRPPRRSVEGA
jgi:molybdopterin/thiamine biosynthesis adenylyltransferase